MRDMVYSEMKLDLFQHRVEFFHEDDEEKKEALCQERAEKFNRQYRRRGVATEEVTYATSDLCERLAIQHILDKNRTYEEGALVYAFVEPFNLLERWERLDARENEPIEDE
jgi:hypothetical protein